MSEIIRKSEIILYQTEDGKTKLEVRMEQESIWLTQAAMAELFQTTPQNITLHLRGIYAEKELLEGATCKENLQVQTEGGRRVSRTRKFYNLPVIIAVGYRVNSSRGTQFRQWATERLNEYLVKGFTIDDERLKQGANIGSDYFDEVLSASGIYARVKNGFIRKSGTSINWQLIMTQRPKKPWNSLGLFRINCILLFPEKQRRN